MGEIREADNTIFIEITGPASSAIELGESTEIRISDPAVSREIRIIYPLNCHDVAIVKDRLTALVVDRGYPDIVGP
jgi:hypothetical protein